MQRPHILVNVAATVDGKIDTVTRKGATLSSQADKRRVDLLRAGVDAVLVGGHTLLAEDPKLTVKSKDLRAERLKEGRFENPAKIGVVSMIPPHSTNSAGGIAARSGKIDALNNLRNFLFAGPAEVFLFTTSRTSPEIIAELRNLGAVVNVNDGERVDLQNAFHFLHSRGIQSVLVEGGGTLIAELFRLGLVDELTVYLSPRIFGGASAPTLADGAGFLPEQAPRLSFVSMEKLDPIGGVLLRYRILNSHR